MIPPFGHHPNCHFLGFPMSQNRYAIPAWSYLFEMLPPQRIIEIGTSVGGMTCLLAIACREYVATLHTFDISPTMSAKTEETLRHIAGPLVSVNVVDVLSPEGISAIASIIQLPGLSIVLCDGGNKVEEVRTFTPFLKTGDIIAAHDFGGRDEWPWQEIRLEQVNDVLKNYKMSLCLMDVFQNTGWGVWGKVKDY